MSRIIAESLASEIADPSVAADPLLREEPDEEEDEEEGNDEEEEDRNDDGYSE